MDQQSLEALLSSLRNAQDGTEPAPPPSSTAPPPPAQADLDALLSTLTALPDVHASTPPPPALPAQQRTRDVSGATFQEALPLLNSLSLDGKWMDKVEAVWEEQKTFEFGLKDERNRLQGELDRSGLSAAVKTGRLKEWDRAALKRWGNLQGQQQERLQSLGVPTFRKTTDPTILKRQERVLGVLVGFLEDRDT
ncbi:hypothetical protein JCM11251_000946 [Rhodosporidiobolus azoricus]